MTEERSVSPRKDASANFVDRNSARASLGGRGASLPRAARRSRLGALSHLLLLVGLAAAVPACEKGGAGAASASEDKHPLVGSPAPEFDLPAQSGGKRASLANAKGKVLLVDFWATWCGPCRASFPRYEELAQKLGDDVMIVGLSEDDEADGIAAFAKDTGATFTLAWDRDKRIAGAYKPSSMPTSFIVDRDGLVRFVHTGFRDGDESIIEKQIKSLLE
ncbi:MAG TPA: TlpA disulfide reductase family protein [Polyangiaceae bacterium]|nr:TlpA disulfide reductase family protein [Polyangiaceae bacterium]